MDQPKGFIDTSKFHHICKPNKALYGLKQALGPSLTSLKIQWFLNEAFETLNLTILCFTSGYMVIFFWFWSMLMIWSLQSPVLSLTTDNCHSINFCLRGFGGADYFLSIKVAKISSDICLPQTKCIAYHLAKNTVSDYSPVPTPTSNVIISLNFLVQQ